MKEKIEVAGFTLIELLVVVLIIGILAAVALPQYQKAVKKARFMEAFSNLQTIAQADDACQLSKGHSCDWEDLDIDIGIPTSAYATSGVRKTKYFGYMPGSWGMADPKVKAYAMYQEGGEEACLCFLEGKVVISGDYCWESSIVDAKLLNVEEDSRCGCC